MTTIIKKETYFSKDVNNKISSKNNGINHLMRLHEKGKFMRFRNKSFILLKQ